MWAWSLRFLANCTAARNRANTLRKLSLCLYSQKVLDRNQKPLAQGTEFRFEVRQENLPRGWNYRVPVTEVSKIGY